MSNKKLYTELEMRRKMDNSYSAGYEHGKEVGEAEQSRRILDALGITNEIKDLISNALNNYSQ